MPKRLSTRHRRATQKAYNPQSWPRMTLWLDRDVIAAFRRTGQGWKLRINDTLRKAAKLPAVKRKKA